MSVDFVVRGRRGIAIFTGGSVILDNGLCILYVCILSRSESFKVKHLNDRFVFYTNMWHLTPQDIN